MRSGDRIRWIATGRTFDGVPRAPPEAKVLLSYNESNADVDAS